jgi:hypothetical protein
MNRYIALIMSHLLLCPAFADQVIFSQYDGVNTWNNVYVEVDNAADFVKPGVGFAPAFAGSESAGSEAVAGSTGSKTRRYDAISAYMIDTYTKASISSTFYDRRSMQVYAYGTTTPAYTVDTVVTDPNASNKNAKAVWEVIVEDVQAQEEVQKSWEQSLPARAIVVVDTPEDMEKRISDFFPEGMRYTKIYKK